MKSSSNKTALRALRTAAGVLGVSLLAACASMGRPEGGARDELPPVFVRGNPAPGAVNVRQDRIDLYFDENISLDDAFNKVVVSPTQKETPVVRSLGRHLTVELRDTLRPNTTYTVDFADAVKDLNEGNILDGFAIDFSTGPTIDTLRISGMVLDARTLEPAQGMLVGVHTDPSDTTLRSVPFERIARTNQYGQFTVRGLRPGRYGVYAVNDVNRDHRWDRSEDVAWYDVLVEPSVKAITVSDTLRNALDQDSVVTRPGVSYLPDDILLTWFNEGYKPQYLKDYRRPQRNIVHIGMGAPADSLPEVIVAAGPLAGSRLTDMALLESNVTRDSLIYWLRDPRILATDSLMLSVRHQQTDSLERIVWQTDTLRFFWHEPKKKEKKKKDSDTIPEPTPLIDLQMVTKMQHEVYDPLRLVSGTPLNETDPRAFHLEMFVDSVWTPVEHGDPEPDSLAPLRGLTVAFDPEPGAKYRFTVDSASVYDIYGIHNGPVSHEFQVRAVEEYANLAFNVTGNDSIPFVVELLNDNDKPIRTGLPDDKGRVIFRYLDPAAYYARLFLDSNGNGEWDTGSVADSLQAEEVFYYPKAVTLRANWDVENNWDIYEKAVDEQKPNKIKKNKPKRRNDNGRQDEDGDVQYDEWGDPIDPNDPNYRDSFGNRRGNNRNNNRGGFNGIGGGFQQSSGNNATLRR